MYRSRIKGAHLMKTTIPREEIEMKPEVVKLQKRGQLTLPAAVRKELGLEENVQLEITVEDGRIILNPVITIGRDQAWFWTKEWQNGEKEAQNDIEAGDVTSFDNVDDAIGFLRGKK